MPLTIVDYTEPLTLGDRAMMRAEREQWDALERRITQLERLVRIILEEDPNDAAADAVTVLDVWRKEAREVLGE